MAFFGLFCEHRWTKVSEITSKSSLEQMHSLGYRPRAALAGALLKLASKEHVVILKCDTCGKLERIVTNLSG